jgi:hypothetical protein
MSNGNLGELPMFLVFSSVIELRLNSPIFHCFLTAICFIPVSIYNFSKMISLGLVTFSWLCFQMNMDNYPHMIIAEDESLCSTSQHRLGFP